MKTDTDYYAEHASDLYETLLLKSEVYSLIHDFFKNNQYIYVDPPILHEQIQGKKREVYLSLYNNKYSLNSSNALFMAAYASAFRRVYSISASVRDEHDPINHLIEFRMLEVETQDMLFDDLLDFIELLLLSVLKGLLNKSVVQKSEKLTKRISNLISEFPIARIPYYDVLEELNEKYRLNLDDSVDLCLIDSFVSGFLKSPIFIIDYPWKIATWTAKRKAAKTAYAFNLMLPDSYGELSEGCQRNNNADQIRYKLNCAKITNLEWYAASIEKMSGERSGFGMGIERLMRWIVGTEKISDVVYFPRINDMENK